MDHPEIVNTYQARQYLQGINPNLIANALPFMLNHSNIDGNTSHAVGQLLSIVGRNDLGSFRYALEHMLDEEEGEYDEEHDEYETEQYLSDNFAEILLDTVWDYNWDMFVTYVRDRGYNRTYEQPQTQPDDANEALVTEFLALSAEQLAAYPDETIEQLNEKLGNAAKLLAPETNPITAELKHIIAANSDNDLHPAIWEEIKLLAQGL